MGYTTEFSGSFELNKPLSPKMKEFLTKLAETRRMGRMQHPIFGIEGEFYVGAHNDGQMGQSHSEDVIDHNTPPSTQPGLWCQWIPNEDGTAIEWDGGEKFYSYTEWLMYIIHKILAPNGYILNGHMTWQGEETGDVGEIYVENNKVFTEPYHGKKTEIKIEDVFKDEYVSGKGFVKSKNFMRVDIVLEEETMRAANIADMKKVREVVAVEKKAPTKKTPVKKTPKKKSVTIKIEGLKNDLDEKQMKALLKVVRQYTEGLVDKKESEYTLKHKRKELKAN